MWDADAFGIAVKRAADGASSAVSLGAGESQAGSVCHDVVGKINPRELELIQELRRKLRLAGRAYNTEASTSFAPRFVCGGAAEGG